MRPLTAGAPPASQVAGRAGRDARAGRAWTMLTTWGDAVRKPDPALIARAVRLANGEPETAAAGEGDDAVVGGGAGGALPFEVAFGCVVRARSVVLAMSARAPIQSRCDGSHWAGSRDDRQRVSVAARPRGGQ